MNRGTDSTLIARVSLNLASIVRPFGDLSISSSPCCILLPRFIYARSFRLPQGRVITGNLRFRAVPVARCCH